MALDSINGTSGINLTNNNIADYNSNINGNEKIYIKISDELEGLDNFVSTTKSSANKSNIDPSTFGPNISNQQKTAKEVEAFLLEAEKEIEALTKQLEEKQREIEKLQKQRSEKQEELQKQTQLYENSQKELKELQAQKTRNENTYKLINESIEEATGNLESTLKKEQQDAMYDAMSKYNEEEDGNWNDFLQEHLEGVVPDSGIQLLISNLDSKLSSTETTITRLDISIASKSREVSNYKTSVDNLTAEVQGLDTQIGISQNESYNIELNLAKKEWDVSNTILSAISETERNLVKEKGLDLTETFPNGKNKYIVAPGQHDGLLHIYELDSENATQATSLVRKYVNGGGLNIIASGNGYMCNIGSSPCNESTVYNFTCMDSDVTECKIKSDTQNYITSSPLSFDLNGDGVRTSERMVDFDIDGDGIVDRINDSADGVLVFDKDGDGISGADGSETFGDNTDLDGDGIADGYKNGFEALMAMASKEGLVNGNDDMVLDSNDLSILEEKYGLKIKVDGYGSEAKSLKDVGITEINLSNAQTVLNKDFDGNQNDLMTQEGATFKINGEERSYADIWHSKK